MAEDGERQECAKDRALSSAAALPLLALCLAAIFAARAAAGDREKQQEQEMEEARRPLAIAHRGFRGIAPENTLFAARLGLETGAELWELDVAASSDGELVVLHDDSLARTSDAKSRFPGRSPWIVYDFSLEEIRSLDAGSWYGSADPFGQVKAGRVGKAELAAFAGLQIPTLREALEFTRDAGWKVNIEIKDATGHSCDAWIVEKTLELVRELGLVDQVILSSFNHNYIVKSKKLEPSIPTGALVERPAADPVALLRSTGASTYNPGLKGLKEEAVRAVRAAGFGVLIWTVNEEADMERVLSWGATGIFSDFPDRLVAVRNRLRP